MSELKNKLSGLLQVAYVWLVVALAIGLLAAVVIIFSSLANAYNSDIQLNITQDFYNTTFFNSTTNTTTNFTSFYINYTLRPNAINVAPNTTYTIEINNLDNKTENVTFTAIGFDASVTWYTYALINGSTGYGAVRFNDVGSGFFRINISGLNTSIKAQPAISVNVSIPIILPKIDYYLGVHECRNFTIVENVVENGTAFRNITICGNYSTCGWNDLNPDIQTAQLNNLTSALQAWLAALNNKTGIVNGTNITTTKYYWETVPECQTLLKDYLNLKSCDAQVEKARTEVIDFYTGEIKKKNAELGSMTDAKTQCDGEKKTALETSEVYNVRAIECEKTKRNETETAVETLRRNEVLPAVGVAGALIAFVFVVAIYRLYKNQRPEKMIED